MSNKQSKNYLGKLTTASDLHPYACILEKCPHCLRIVSENHNPKTCYLCNFEDWEEKEENDFINEK